MRVTSVAERAMSPRRICDEEEGYTVGHKQGMEVASNNWQVEKQELLNKIKELEKNQKSL